MKNRPAYAIGSVDSALLLATLLRLEGPMGVTEAARQLGVAPSTAHRLLGMLVYRDFARQLPDRRYTAGPVWRDAPAEREQVARLREVALPHLQRLVETLGESANLMILSGRDVRFLATVECERALRVGDRTGRVLPAHRVSGGKAILAALPPAVVAEQLDGLDEREARRLGRDLRAIRRRGYAINDQATETGLTAVGVALAPDTRAALSIALPTARFSAELPEACHAALAHAAAAIDRELETARGG